MNVVRERIHMQRRMDNLGMRSEKGAYDYSERREGEGYETRTEFS